MILLYVCKILKNK